MLLGERAIDLHEFECDRSQPFRFKAPSIVPTSRRWTQSGLKMTRVRLGMGMGS